MDNDLKHTAKAKSFKERKRKKWNFLTWPIESAEINSIEHVAHLLETKLKPE